MSHESSTEDGVAAESAAAELTSETAYTVLSDKRRRYAIHYLKQAEDPVTVRELAEQLDDP